MSGFTTLPEREKESIVHMILRRETPLKTFAVHAVAAAFVLIINSVGYRICLAHEEPEYTRRP